MGFIQKVNLPISIFIATAAAHEAKTKSKPKAKSKSKKASAGAAEEVEEESSGGDAFRKPATGMWQFLVHHCNDAVAPDMEVCMDYAASMCLVSAPHPPPLSLFFFFYLACGAGFVLCG
jgi:hypothetical protein